MQRLPTMNEGGILSARRCGLLLHMSHVTRSVCRLVFDAGTRVNCAKTTGSIEMSFWGQICVGQSNNVLYEGGSRVVKKTAG